MFLLAIANRFLGIEFKFFWITPSVQKLGKARKQRTHQGSDRHTSIPPSCRPDVLSRKWRSPARWTASTSSFPPVACPSRPPFPALERRRRQQLLHPIRQRHGRQHRQQLRSSSSASSTTTARSSREPCPRPRISTLTAMTMTTAALCQYEAVSHRRGADPRTTRTRSMSSLWILAGLSCTRLGRRS
jgi:hypothetical protein